MPIDIDIPEYKIDKQNWHTFRLKRYTRRFIELDNVSAEVLNWCDEQIEDPYYFFPLGGVVYYCFKSEADAFAFKLKWL